MEKPFLRILIYCFINLSKQDYEIVDFYDQNTTVSIKLFILHNIEGILNPNKASSKA